MITRCRKCNKMFNSNGVLGLNKCPECVAKKNEKAKLVRDIVKDNPGINTAAIVAMTGISSKEIANYSKEGFLELSNPTENDTKCEICGDPISTGRYCIACRTRYQYSLKA